MFKKALHRITVLWCLYGVVRLATFIHPLLIRLCRWSGFDEHLYGLRDWDDKAMMWALTLIGIGVIVLISFGIHHFSNWFFNTDK